MACVVVIGATDVARRTCALLLDAGIDTRHLSEPSDAELKSVLPGISGVAVLVHDDIRALRYCLTVEHIVPNVRMFAAIFDNTARLQVQQAVPNCVVLSPAAIALPSLVASVLAPDSLGVVRSPNADSPRWLKIAQQGGEWTALPFGISPKQRTRGMFGMLRGQFRPYDAGSAVLMLGALGLALVTTVDAVLASSHSPWPEALYEAARTTATIAAPDVPTDTPRLLWATIAALLVMAFTAAFGAGIVHHLLSGRHTALMGRRVIPRSGHVIVAGMGQVGLRLAQELQAIGVPVVGIDPDTGASGLAIARERSIPVVIGDATTRTCLERVGLRRAIALVAATSEDRDSIAVAVSANAVAPDVRVVMRAGSEDASEQTRALWPIAPVVDVNGLTAAFVARSVLDEAPIAVTSAGGRFVSFPADETVSTDGRGAVPSRCGCC